MDFEVGSIITLESKAEFYIIGIYNINEKTYFIGRNQKNVGEMALFEYIDKKIRVVKEKKEIDMVLSKITEK